MPRQQERGWAAGAVERMREVNLNPSSPFLPQHQAGGQKSSSTAPGCLLCHLQSSIVWGQKGNLEDCRKSSRRISRTYGAVFLSTPAAWGTPLLLQSHARQAEVTALPSVLCEPNSPAPGKQAGGTSACIKPHVWVAGGGGIQGTNV